MEQLNICCPSYLKERIRPSFKIEDKIKFYTYEQVCSVLTYSYDNKALEYVFKKYAGNNISLAHLLVENAAYIKDGAEEDNKKIEGLLSIKKDLIEKGFFKEDSIGKFLLRRKKMVLVGYEDKSSFFKLLKDNNVTFEIKDTSEFLTDTLKVKVIRFNELSQEFEECINSIADLLSKKMDPKSIEIVLKSDYASFFSSLAKLSNLETYYDDVLVNSTPYFQQFYLRLANGESKEELLKEDDGYDGKVSGLIEEFIGSLEGINNKDFTLAYLMEWSKKTSFASTEKGIKISSSLHPGVSNLYTFFLSFDSNYPRKVKDGDYLTDVEKDKYSYLEPSYRENVYLKNDILRRMSITDNLRISFSFAHPVNGEIKESELLQDKDFFSVEDYQYPFMDRYSKVGDQLIYSVLNADNKAYGEDSLAYRVFQRNVGQSYVPFVRDNHSVKFDVSSLKLSYSFSSLTSYLTCPYQYFLKKIYRIDDSSENPYFMDYGTVFHKTVEEFTKGNKPSYDEVLSCLKRTKEELSPKELFYYQKAYENGIGCMEELNTFKESAGLLDVNTEMDFKYPIKDGVDFKGKIDAVYHNDDGYVVIDYKTGNHKFNTDDVVNGFDMQLACYTAYLDDFKVMGDRMLFGFYFVDALLFVDPVRKPHGKAFSGFSVFNHQEKPLPYLIALAQNEGVLSYISKSTRCPLEFDQIKQRVKECVNQAVEGISQGEFTPIRKEYAEDNEVPSANNIKCTKCPFADCCYYDEKDNPPLRIKKIVKDTKKNDDDSEENNSSEGE